LLSFTIFSPYFLHRKPSSSISIWLLVWNTYLCFIISLPPFLLEVSFFLVFRYSAFLTWILEQLPGLTLKGEASCEDEIGSNTSCFSIGFEVIRKVVRKDYSKIYACDVYNGKKDVGCMHFLRRWWNMWAARRSICVVKI